ncbi:MAG TPA: biotin/lipoyl-containing protein, partial [Burkholderiales bacterium]
MSVVEVKVPDIGDFKNVPVIEVLVKPGDRVERESPLVTLESDKATMEVPSPAAGVVKELRVKVGDKVSEGSPVLTLESSAESAAAKPAPQQPPAAKAEVEKSAPAPQPAPAMALAAPPSSPPPPRPAPVAPAAVDQAGFARAHASPSVRRFA